MNISLQPQGVPEGESGPPPLQNGQEHCIHHTTYLVQSDFFFNQPNPFSLDSDIGNICPLFYVILSVCNCLLCLFFSSLTTEIKSYIDS